MIALTGDVMLGRGVGQAYIHGGWERAFSGLVGTSPVADFTFANLESPLTEAPLERAAFDLRAPVTAVAALRGAGIDVVSLANNHALDAGASGLRDTRNALADGEIVPVGPGTDSEMTSAGGMRIAWLAFDDTLLPLELQPTQDAILRAREVADLVIVSVHWGAEGDSGPRERQLRLAQAFASAGADVVAGHHPHRLQPTGWIWGNGRGRPTLVAYSLGNALFDQGAPPAARVGALVLIRAGPQGAWDACAWPLQIQADPWRVTSASPAVARTAESALGLRDCSHDP
ncbi:MAG TPA: CapA family protein [Anaerolineales bacterium]|nr:CapA family protein [Anaerolineales bacterium]